eukprot:1228827-Amphidinium_carterae.1
MAVQPNIRGQPPVVLHTMRVASPVEPPIKSIQTATYSHHKGGQPPLITPLADQSNQNTS